METIGTFAAAPNLDELAHAVPHPMVVVTAGVAGHESGCLVGFHTQVSRRPPRLAVGISHANHTYDTARRAGTLAVHYLDARHATLAALFGEETGEEVGKLDRCSWHRGPCDVPLLDDVPNRVIGRTLDIIPLGDHDLFVLAPVVTEFDPVGRPLTSDDVTGLEAGHDH